jgi:UDP-N-acetylmuramate: L-alanyl-gamma-D-glutamyl-meso-diaminopimelate ligase
MRIYFMSVCGTGMGNGALLMRSLGHEVLGSDVAAYPPMSDCLRRNGIEVLEGYDAERLRQMKPDLVVVGNVNTRGNPEIEWLLEGRAIPFVSLPELLSREILASRDPIVVAGTHGKTTTTTLTAFILSSNGLNPGFFIGGVPYGASEGAALGSDDAPFVLEGDEYDSAFFDKRAKFIHYRPKWLVINNLEFDHADIYRDLADVERSFRHLLKLVPRNGAILVNGDDPNLGKLVDVDWAPVYRVGEAEDADLRIVDFEETVEGSRFRLYFRGKHWSDIRWEIWGLFNARNAAMAALAAALSLGLRSPTDLKLSALKDFKGVRRRQEILFHDKAMVLMVDFGHHPTAIGHTVASLRSRFPGQQLVVCFEARSNTACRNIHTAEFEAAFARADAVHFGAIHRPERYSDAERIDLRGMADRLGPMATAHVDNKALEDKAWEILSTRSGVVMVFFSNGSFDQIPQRLADRLKNRAAPIQEENLS